jgi:hypothetical protein
MSTIIAAIHGILTSQTEASWPDKLDAWMYQRDPAVKVLKKEYAAGPFPRWNCWVKDPWLARSLAHELELFLAAFARAGSPAPLPAVWFVAHSNGAVIALLATRTLIDRGCHIGGLILTGAACEADVEKNGVADWLRRGRLGRAIAYSSAEDMVLPGPAQPRSSRRNVRLPAGCLRHLLAWLWRKLAWPYGSLGRTGWLTNGWPLSTGHAPSAPVQGKIFTRWFSGGHTTYFTADHIADTFDTIYRDLAPGEGAATEGGS